MTEAETIVSNLCMAFERMNADELIEYFADDALYHNIPLPPLRGRRAIHAFLTGLPDRYQRLRVEMLQQISAGNLVMNERIDYFTIAGREIPLPIAGVFELENGKVKPWRDYFDLGTLRAPAPSSP